MALPTPVPGLVIRYSYLWHSEYLAGRDEGRKDRPCAIIAAIQKDESGETRVLVLPITHSRPDPETAAVEIPAPVKRRLRLDNGSSWVILSEWNEFAWPGYDLRRVPGADDASVAYGPLPPGLFATIRDRFLVLVKTGSQGQVKRS